MIAVCSLLWHVRAMLGNGRTKNGHHGGKVLFQMERDALLDNHRLVKGDKRALNAQCEKLFLSFQRSEYGFVGVAHKVAEVQKSMPGSLWERPSVEDIMLACTKRSRF